MIARLARAAVLPLILSGLAACAGDEAPEPKKADEFAQVLAVAPAADGKLGRVVLPAAAMAEIHRTDLGDVRIFDAKGRTLSLALAYGRSGESALLQTHDLPAIPAAIAADGTTVPRAPDSIGATGAPSDTGDAAAATSARGAVLIDTHNTARPVVAIELAVSLPTDLAVTFTLESSADRKVWAPIAEKILLRPGSDPEVLGQPRIALPGLALGGQYLRISWPAGPDIAVTGAKVIEAVERQPPRLELETSGAKLTNSHELRFAPQLAVPIAAVTLAMTGQDGIVPVQLLGRNDPRDNWGLLASGTLKQGEAPLSLELSGASLREYRILADQRSAGFSREPRIALAVQPITIFAAFNGEGPFNLAVGHPAAKPAWFDPADFGKPSDLLRAWRQQAEVASAGDAPVVMLAPAAPENSRDLPAPVLWGAILAALAALAAAGWRLRRGRAADRAA